VQQTLCCCFCNGQERDASLKKNINERLASDPSFYPLPGFQLMLLVVVLLFITFVICASGSACPRLKCLFCLFNADRHASLSSTLAVEDEEGLKGLQSGFFCVRRGRTFLGRDVTNKQMSSCRDQL